MNTSYVDMRQLQGSVPRLVKLGPAEWLVSCFIDTLAERPVACAVG
jgi:hypothetical protein